jgi:hypothetical protein
MPTVLTATAVFAVAFITQIDGYDDGRRGVSS